MSLSGSIENVPSLYTTYGALGSKTTGPTRTYSVDHKIGTLIDVSKFRNPDLDEHSPE
jgi:hypothetical protein